MPEDRKKDGLFLQLSAATNLTINIAGPTARSGVVRGRYLREHAARVAADFGVRVASLAVPARLLSGGNQQKLLLGRWLTRNLRLLILDEPTRGVDVGAKGEIYRLIDGFAAEGMTVLMISSELPEIIALCDRVAVMREGRVAGVLDRDEGDSFTQEAMMALATGATLPTS